MMHLVLPHNTKQHFRETLLCNLWELPMALMKVDQNKFLFLIQEVVGDQPQKLLLGILIKMI